MTARKISNVLVSAMMSGTNDMATLRKIKKMGERLEYRIIKYAQDKCEERDHHLKKKFKEYYPNGIDVVNIKSYQAAIEFCFAHADKPDFD